MVDVSKNFNRSEFACKCGCGQDTIDAELVNILQDCRDRFGPIRINSGNRCEAHNAKVGGTKNSQHLYGRAADFVPLEASLDDVYNHLNIHYDGIGLGLYSGWLHVDSRGKKARW